MIKEIQILVLAAVLGFLLLFPRLLLMHELTAPSIVKTPFQAIVEKVFSTVKVQWQSLKNPFQKAKIPAAHFKPSSKKAQRSDEELRMEGIIYDQGGGSTAIINDQILKAGDTVNQFTISEIKQDEVALEKAGAVYVLSSTTGLHKIREAGQPLEAEGGSKHE